MAHRSKQGGVTGRYGRVAVALLAQVGDFGGEFGQRGHESLVFLPALLVQLRGATSFFPLALAILISLPMLAPRGRLAFFIACRRSSSNLLTHTSAAVPLRCAAMSRGNHRPFFPDHVVLPETLPMPPTSARVGQHPSEYINVHVSGALSPMVAARLNRRVSRMCKPYGV